MNRILVVEDEQHLAEGLRFNLEAEGYGVEVVDTGEAALDLLLGPTQPLDQAQPLDPAQPLARDRIFDIVVLDVMLPGKSGFTVVSEMRQAGQFVPTLILTARGHSDDVLQGFAAGADDYLTKPFDLTILIARIQGLLRRREWLRRAHPEIPSVPAQERNQERSDVFTFGDKAVFFELLELHVRDQIFPLTLMEMNVLRYLIRHEGKPVSRKAMLEEVWGLHEDTDTRAIDNFIVRLRRYIEDDPTKPRHLLTVRGVGYRFIANPPKAG
jgi:two-component system, OmpR family, alkaline phosphatase synthesis response regulator PhoP